MYDPFSISYHGVERSERRAHISSESHSMLSQVKAKPEGTRWASCGA